MLVYEIGKEYAPVFSDFAPQYVLNQIGKPGYHTLGEVFNTGEELYPAGFLQYYDGNNRKEHEPKLIHIYVPEEERGEANSWSMLAEMENRLKRAGLHKISVNLIGEQENTLKDYFYRMGFEDAKEKPELLTTPIDSVLSDKLLSVPENSAVTPLKKIPKGEMMETLKAFGEDRDINADSISMDLSMMYKDKDCTGLFLISMLPEGGLYIKMMRLSGGDDMKPVLYMLSASAKILKKAGASGIPVFVPLYNKKTEKLIKALVPDVELDHVWQGEKTYE